MQLTSSLFGGFLKASVKEIEEWSHLVPCGALESYTRNLTESTLYIKKGEETNLWYCIIAFAFALWKLIDKKQKRLKTLNIQFVFPNLYTINYIRKNIKSFLQFNFQNVTIDFELFSGFGTEAIFLGRDGRIALIICSRFNWFFYHFV